LRFSVGRDPEPVIDRYESVAWRTALDIDASAIGHALEQELLVASERIPELVLEAISD